MEALDGTGVDRSHPGDVALRPADEPEGAATPVTGRSWLPPHGRRRWGWAYEAVAVLAFYYLYQGVRNAAGHRSDTDGRAIRHALRLVDWERALHLYNEHAWQQAFLHATWIVRVLNIYYGTLHFFVTGAVLVWMYRHRYSAYRTARTLLAFITALGLFGYWFFPLAPPRLLPGAGFVDTLYTVGGLWSYESPVAKGLANPYAAMPSLHFGWSMWCTMVMIRYSTSRLRWLFVLYPVGTLLAIVVTGNHYWLDAAGAAVVVAASIGAVYVVSRLRPAVARARARASLR